MGDIVPIKKHRDFERKTRRSAAGCLREVRSLKPSEVLVMGFDAGGNFFVQSSPPDPAQAMWLMVLATKRLLGEH